MGNKTLIMIADDEESILDFMSAVLASNDFAVIRAKNGKTS